jgi:hypothetical protein
VPATENENVHIPNLVTFLPVEDPGLPFPYQSGTAKQKDDYEKSELGKLMFWENMQKVNNHTAIAAGNKAASEACDKYNGETETYWLNGGESSGRPLPSVDSLELEQYYLPAVDATAQYIPPSGGQPGRWVEIPGAPDTKTPEWTLPAGTVLYTVLP